MGSPYASISIASAYFNVTAAVPSRTSRCALMKFGVIVMNGERDEKVSWHSFARVSASMFSYASKGRLSYYAFPQSWRPMAYCNRRPGNSCKYRWISIKVSESGIITSYTWIKLKSIGTLRLLSKNDDVSPTRVSIKLWLSVATFPFHVSCIWLN